LLERRGKFGRPFFGCGRYPKCDYLVNSLEEVANYTPENNAPMEAKAEEQPATKRTKTSTGKKRAKTTAPGSGTPNVED
jgi:DNA topoisomerase-1